MKKIASFTLLLFLCNLKIFAQEIQIKGFIKDEITNEEIPFATIALFNEGEIVDGISSNENGEFQLKTDKKFTYIEVSFIGYNKKQLLFSEIINLKELVIGLTVDESALDEIIIEGTSTTTQLKIDRKIIRLGNDIQQAGVNALEAFDQIPEIETDIALGTISLRGSDNVRVLINGKPSSLSASEVLQQISASSINRIEIITSPSAKHQADGISGIINIILKKNANTGLNLTVNASAGTKRHGYGINGNYNLGSTNFRLNASKESSKINNEQTLFRQFSSGHTENIFTPYKFDGDVYKVSSGVDFFIKDKHEFSFEVDYTEDTHNNFNSSNYSNVTNTDDFIYLRDNDHFHYNTILNSNYRLNLDDDNHFLELDYNLNISNNDYPLTDFRDDTFVIKQFLTENFVLQALALDYTFPMAENLVIESGASWNAQNLESERAISLANGDETDNLFKYDEHLFGAYALGKLSLDNFNLQAGLRYEYFKSTSKIDIEDTTLKKKVSNLFPSVHLSYNINDDSSINLGYSRRVSRPNFHHVNAFQLMNPLSIWEYNPNITPEFSDNIEFNFQKRINGISFSIASFYRHRQDVILWTEFSLNDIQIFRYENSGAHNSFGFEGSLSAKPISFWNTRISGNYYFTKMNQSNLVTWDESYSSRIQLKNTFTINKKIVADITYLYLPKRQGAFNYIKSRNRLDLSVRGKLIKNRLTANLRVVDILNSYQFKRKSVTQNLIQDTEWDFQSQTTNYLLSLTYKLFENKGKTRNRKERNYNEAPIE